MFIFYDSLGAPGGSQTLKLRMCKWLVKHNIKCELMTANISSKETIYEFEQLNINIKYFEKKSYKKIFEYVSSFDDLTLICFTLDAYLDIEYVKYMYKCAVNSILYCIHPDGVKKGMNVDFSPANKLMISYYKRIVRKMIKNHSLVFMDELCQNSTLSYYSLNSDQEISIWRLPVVCPKHENPNRIIQNGYNKNIILTAARADFPFKGYIIGLINEFANIYKNMRNVKLEIISAGKDYNQIKEAVSLLDENVRSNIVLKGWMPNDQLILEIQKCKLYIGMGTTVIDASLNYKPSIAVKYNTYNLQARQLFYQNVNINAEDDNCDLDAAPLINNVLNSSFEVYKEMCKLTFENTKQVYDMDNIMNIVINYSSNYKESIFSAGDFAIHSVLFKLKKWRMK